jgi:hypothetical protein
MNEFGTYFFAGYNEPLKAKDHGFRQQIIFEDRWLNLGNILYRYY